MKIAPWTKTLTLLILILFAELVWARAGGGSSKGKGGLLALILSPFFMIYAAYIGRKITKRSQQISAALNKMAEREPNWAKDKLTAFTERRFIELQTAWGDQDLKKMKTLLHPNLYPSWGQQILSQKKRNEKNIMAGLSVEQIRLVGAKNYDDDELDEFTACIDAQADDQTLVDDKIIKSENSSFREFWTFEWEQDQWKLRSVTQANGWKKYVYAPIIWEGQ